MELACCQVESSFWDNFATSDWITLFGILINSFLAYWIVSTIQNKISNKRFLKDHFIEEVKSIRSEYENYIYDVYNNKVNVKRLIAWFKLMNMKSNDLLDLIYETYGIKKDYLKPYQIQLKEILTNSDEYNFNFKQESEIQFTEETVAEVIKFEQKHQSLFNRLIVEINNHK